MDINKKSADREKRAYTPISLGWQTFCVNM